jgi:Peptidase inhibitor family I36
MFDIVWFAVLRGILEFVGLLRLADGRPTAATASEVRPSDVGSSLAAKSWKDLVTIVLWPVVAVVLALSPLLTVGRVAVAQNPPFCEQDRVCLYENFGFGGRRWAFLPGTSNLGREANDKASSVFNNTSRAVLLYSDPGFRGSVICLNPRATIDNLALFGLNDTLSSVNSGPAEGCN